MAGLATLEEHMPAADDASVMWLNTLAQVRN
jgi:hypothetical protein